MGPRPRSSQRRNSRGRFMWFTRVSINNPVFATMMMVAIVVLGLFSYQRLSIEQMPDISIPVAVVYTPYVGASAQAVEQDVTRPIEEVINTINGIKAIRSYSRESSSVVVAEFELNIDAKAAVQDVRDKVAQARRGFNRDVGEPSVTRAENDNDQPLIYLSMRSDSRSLRELSELTERLLVKRLQGAQGVGSIEVNGAVQRELAILLDPQKMAAQGVGIDQIVNAIRVEKAGRACGRAGVRYQRAPGARAGQAPACGAVRRHHRGARRCRFRQRHHAVSGRQRARHAARRNEHFHGERKTRDLDRGAQDARCLHR